MSDKKPPPPTPLSPSTAASSAAKSREDSIASASFVTSPALAPKEPKVGFPQEVEMQTGQRADEKHARQESEQPLDEVCLWRLGVHGMQNVEEEL